MQIKEMQIVLAVAGFYGGAIDGVLGPKSKSAFDQVAHKYRNGYMFKVLVWRERLSHQKNERKLVAAVQACLNGLGYGCAIDWFAAPNGLRTRCPKALFCGPDYKDFLDIMEANEWLPAIRLWGADAMHFQRAKL